MKPFFFLLFLAVVLASGCRGDQPETQSSSDQPLQKVAIRTMLFSPATIAVKSGEVIEWKNDDLVPHTVTASSFDSGSIAPGQTWRHTFAQAGTFPYVCTFHPTMKGEVVVK